MKLLEILREMFLNETEPRELAHKMGLVYGGHAQWLDPKSREVVAKTVGDKLVKTTGADAGGEDETKGAAIILDFDTSVLHANVENPKMKQAILAYNALLRKVLITGYGAYFIMASRDDRKDVELFMKTLGITANIQIVPISKSKMEVKKKFVQKVANQGFKKVLYFDRDAEAVGAIDSLKSTLSKQGTDIETHTLEGFEDAVKQVSTGDVGGVSYK